MYQNLQMKKMLHFLRNALCISIAIVAPLLSSAKSSNPDNVQPISGGTPLSFIENKGQITDQYRKQRKDIDFKLSSGNITVFVGDGQLHYQWSKVANPETVNQPPQIFNKPASEGDTYVDQTTEFDMYRMDVKLIGANTSASYTIEEVQDYYEQYYTEFLPDGAKARSFKKITYKDIYPNIDWVLYIKDNKLKYDFVVHKGGNANNIKLEYKGADNISLIDGALIATTPFGSITEAKPYTYDIDSKAEVSSKYESSSETYYINGHLKSFSEYIHFITDKNDNIVIDPSLEWATYYGSTNTDNSYSVVTDTAANVYLAGSTNNTSNIATSGAYQTTIGGNVDAMLVRFTEAGIRSFATYYGGSGNDDFFSTTIDDNLNVYLAGTTASTTGIATSGSHQQSYGGGSSDCFVVKLTPSGSRVWATYYGGSDNEKTSTEYQVFIACDSSNNIYIAGNTRSTSGIATSGSFQSSNGGNIDGFVAKFNSSGVRQWGTYIGGSDNDNMRKVAFNSSGDVFAAGEMRSSGLGTSGSHQSSLGGNNDAFLIKFNGSGVRQWSTYYGGTGSDSPQGLYTDYQGNIFMSGSTNSTSGIVTSGTYQTVLNAGGTGSASDAYLVKFNSSGVRQWGTYFGGSNVDHSGDLMVDAQGYPAFTGTTSSASHIATQDGHQTSIGSTGYFDALFAIFTPQGQLSWGSYYGGTDHDYGYGINAAVGGIIYIAGFTGSSNNISQSGHQNTMAGAPDAFVAKFTPDTSAFILQPFIDTVLCVDDTFTLKYGVTAPFPSNNTFTVLLSNASGSFSSPTVIGTSSSTGAGNILCTIPANISAGSGYKVKIAYSDPVDSSFDNGSTIEIKPKPAKPVASSNSPVCDNETLNLTASTTTSGVTYSWTGPQNYSSNVQNATRTGLNSNSAGDYIVTADLNGCARMDTTTVVIINAPNKPVATANNPLCEGETLGLKSVTTTSGVTYHWDGPTAFSSTQQNANRTNIQQADAGDYIIAVTKNGCTTKDTIDIQVIPILTVTPNINVSPGTTVCPTTDLTFSVQNPQTGATYTWTGPNGFSSNSATPTLNDSKKVDSGYYKVIVSLNACSMGEDSIFVNITDTIQPPVLTSNGPVCEGDTLKLNAATIYGGTGTTFTWYEASGGSFTGNFNKLTYNSAALTDGGQYVVKLGVNGCTAYDTVNVTVKPTPPAPTLSNDGPVCEGSNLNFTATNTMSGVSYSWSGPNGYNANVQNPTITNVQLNQAGTYYATSTLNGCESANGSTTVVVNPTPKPQITSDKQELCEGADIDLTATGSVAGTYSWSGPNNLSSSSATIKISNAKLNQTGVYTVEVTSAQGCKGTDTQYIEVIALPTQPIATAEAPVCSGDTLYLDVSNTLGNDVTFSWYSPTGYVGMGKRIFIYPAPVNGSGKYAVIADRRGCTRTDSVDVIVKPTPPTPIASSNSPVNEGETLYLKLENPTSGASYLWSGPYSYRSLTQNPIISPVKLTDAGIYIIAVTVDGCTSETAITVEVNPKRDPRETFILYPNPNDGDFTIAAENMPYDQEIAIEIVNEIGMMVYRDTAKSENLRLEKKISVGGYLASGVYILRTYLSGELRTVKFSIVR